MIIHATFLGGPANGDSYAIDCNERKEALGIWIEWQDSFYKLVEKDGNNWLYLHDSLAWRHAAIVIPDTSSDEERQWRLGAAHRQFTREMIALPDEWEYVWQPHGEKEFGGQEYRLRPRLKQLNPSSPESTAHT